MPRCRTEGSLAAQKIQFLPESDQEGHMERFFNKPRFTRELKRLARENTVQGKPLCVMDDPVFKTMLASDNDDSREALRSLLSACTKREISQVQISRNDLTPPHLNAKYTRLDVHATFNDGEAADVEMQIGKSDDDLKARAALYAAMLLSSQSRKGSAYSEIKRVYQIFFLNCELFRESDKLPRRYSYREETELDVLTSVTEIIFYEMPKLEQKMQDLLSAEININSLSDDEKWCMYMRYRHEKRAAKLIEKLYREEEGIMRAEKAVKGIDRDYLRFARKMAETKNRMDRAQMIYDAKKEGKAEGKAEGHAEGKAEGHAEGKAEGHAEGKAEGHAEGEAVGYERANLEVARKMKNAGKPYDEIAEFTGLSPEAIKGL